MDYQIPNPTTGLSRSDAPELRTRLGQGLHVICFSGFVIFVKRRLSPAEMLLPSGVWTFVRLPGDAKWSSCAGSGPHRGILWASSTSLLAPARQSHGLLSIRGEGSRNPVSKRCRYEPNHRPASLHGRSQVTHISPNCRRCQVSVSTCVT